MSGADAVGSPGLMQSDVASRFDPWAELARHWPEVVVREMPLTGDLLGLVRYPVIVLRAGTSPGQRRSTLTHEIVHLERGIEACSADSPFAAREELIVEAEAARRLIRVVDLVTALTDLGPQASSAALAAALEVDGQLLATRLGLLTSAERTAVNEAVADISHAA